MKYEYAVIPTSDLAAGSDKEEIFLRKLGDEGWELSAIRTISKTRTLYYFKRVKA